MGVIELRFEALQRHLEAWRSADPAKAKLLCAEGARLTALADAAGHSKLRLVHSNDDEDATDAA